MPTGFGKGAQYQGGGGSNFSGDRKELPNGTYRVSHRWTRKQWQDGSDKLQLELRKADDENCVSWLSAGDFRDRQISEDGKTFEGPAISGKTKAAGYLNFFQELANLPDSEMTTLAKLDQYTVQIMQVPNPDSQTGKKQPQLVAVNPPSASPAPAHDAVEADAPKANGHTTQPVTGLSEAQQEGQKALLAYLAEHEVLDTSHKGQALKQLRSVITAENAVMELQIAQEALSEAVLAQAAGYTYDARTGLVVRA